MGRMNKMGRLNKNGLVNNNNSSSGVCNSACMFQTFPNIYQQIFAPDIVKKHNYPLFKIKAGSFQSSVKLKTSKTIC